jgi:hypothetical protein
MVTNDFDAALQALLASLPPLPVPQQPTTPSQNPTDAQAQQQNGLKVVRTGEKTYSKPTKMTNAHCPQGCYFEGKVYSFKVVDAKGNPLPGKANLTETLTNVPAGKSKPTSYTTSMTNGAFTDMVGYGSVSRNFNVAAGTTVTDQSFGVTQNGHNYPVSTSIRQTVVIDDRGHVFVSERTLVP